MKLRTRIKYIFKSMLSPVPNGEGYAPNSEIGYHAIGLFGQNNAYNIIGNWFFIFCTSVLGVNTVVLGVIFGAARIWDAVNDPIVGAIIDRHRFKSGEKLRPYLLWVAPMIGILSALLFMDFGLSETGKILYIVVIYMAWDILYSFEDIAIWGMTSMMTTNGRQRNTIVQTARIAGSVGGWLPGLIPLMLTYYTYVPGMQLKTVYMLIGLIFGLGGMLISAFAHRVHERVPNTGKEESLLVLLKDLMKNKIIMLIVVANIISAFSLTVPSYYFFFYIDGVTLPAFLQPVLGEKLELGTLSFIYYLVAGIPGMFAMFFATKFAEKFGGMLNVLFIAASANIICRILGFVIGYEGYRIFLNMLIMGVAGIPAGMQGIASTALWGESIDMVEWKTGRRTEGSSFALQNFMGKATSGISIVMSGVLLNILQYEPSEGSRIDASVAGERYGQLIWPLFMLGPIIGSVLYLIPLVFLRYSPKEAAIISHDLAQRRSPYCPVNELQSAVDTDTFFSELGV